MMASCKLHKLNTVLLNEVGYCKHVTSYLPGGMGAGGSSEGNIYLTLLPIPFQVLNCIMLANVAKKFRLGFRI